MRPACRVFKRNLAWPEPLPSGVPSLGRRRRGKPEESETCGVVCLRNIGDEALAARMIDEIAHRGPDAVEVSRLPGVPPRHHRARGRRPADPPGRGPARRQRRDPRPPGPARDPRRERVRDRERQRGDPSPLPLRGEPLDQPARRDVRLRPGDARPHRRGARPPRDQAALRRPPSPRSSRRSTGSR